MDENVCRGLGMLEKALEMEKEGRLFYENALKNTKNKFSREIFSMLMDEETVHIETIKKIYASLNENSSWCEEWKLSDARDMKITSIFEKLARQTSADDTDLSDIKALDIGIDLEKKSLHYYQEVLEDASDKLEREFLEHMIHEEKDHRSALEDMKFFLEDPSSWFREHEHGGLDGG